VEEVVHGSRASGSARSEGDEQVAPGGFVERFEVQGAVALIAKELEQGGTALLLRWLQLAVTHPEKLHLEGLDEEVL
jgi:hypothetical protein